ncbi:MAG: type II toxin-antitoxin system VapC family toxin [Actinomycetia bacterium]|nr:type II toxin-antitoxin system VapC family toxin [Actinomycetes bacterium]
MILYLDTSALVPLLVDEPSSSTCGALWDAASRIATVRLAYVEAAAALAMATRLGRLTRLQHSQARELLDRLWAEIDIIEPDATLTRHAADATVDHALRGYDAMHFSAALAIDAPDLVTATGDRELLAAWRAVGIATADTNSPAP